MCGGSEGAWSGPVPIGGTGVGVSGGRERSRQRRGRARGVAWKHMAYVGETGPVRRAHGHGGASVPLKRPGVRPCAHAAVRSGVRPSSRREQILAPRHALHRPVIDSFNYLGADPERVRSGEGMTR